MRGYPSIKDLQRRGITIKHSPTLPIDLPPGGRVTLPSFSTNKMTSFNRSTPEYRAWKKEAGQMLNAQRAARTWSPLRPDALYSVRILLHVKSKMDTDNSAKAIIDLLHRMGATPDDKWLWNSTQSRSAQVPDRSLCVVDFWPGVDLSPSCNP